MSFHKKNLARQLLVRSIVALSAAGLVACGGSSDSSDGATADPQTGSFSLAVTDAPIDSATEVMVEFTGVAIKPADGEVIEFAFDEPKQINLLALQGDASEGLVNGETVAAGEYEWIRLDVNADADGVEDSYIELIDGKRLELRIPSGAQTGLKLVSGFTVAAGGSTNFTVDFDLRKSIVLAPGLNGTAMLKPALRLVDNNDVGTISGTVDATLVSEQCTDAGLDDGAVYIYSGADVTPTDVIGEDTDPLISALVNFEDGSYSYEAGFLAEGSYTLAYTCDAGLDDPETADEISFVGATTVEVTADSTTNHDFVVEEEQTAEEDQTSEDVGADQTPAE